MKNDATKVTRTVDVINSMAAIANEDSSNLVTRLHTILCLNHDLDPFAKDVLDTMLDTILVATIIDAVITGKYTGNPWDYVDTE